MRTTARTLTSCGTPDMTPEGGRSTWTSGGGDLVATVRPAAKAALPHPCRYMRLRSAGLPVEKPLLKRFRIEKRTEKANG